MLPSRPRRAPAAELSTRTTRRRRLALAMVAVLTLLGNLGAQASIAAIDPSCAATMTETPTCGGGGGGGEYDPPPPSPAEITNRASSSAAGKVGVGYSFQYTQQGTATGPYAVSSGALPPGLTLSDSGLISGVPTAAGTFGFSVTQQTSVNTASANDSITIAARSVPSAPTGASASIASTTSIALAWAAPASSGDDPVTSYAISWAGGSSTATGLSATITGLTTGTAYSFSVAAVSAAGTGAATVANTVTPAGRPGAPTITSATPGNGQQTLVWSPAADNGSAVTQYLVESTTDSGTWSLAAATQGGVSAVVTGPTDGTVVWFRVTAINGLGAGSPSSSMPLRFAAQPGAPVVSATPADGSVSVSWTAAEPNGSPVSSYSVSVSLDGTVVREASSTTPTSTVLTGLTNGTAYQVTVAATNGIGATTSSGVMVTPRGIPGAVSDLAASSGDTASILTWSAAEPNGDAVTYTVERSDDGAHWSTVMVTPATTQTLNELTNGTRYSFRVTAHNAAGAGMSSAIITATPYGVPGSPDDVAAVPGDGAVAVTWAAPTSDGGRAVTTYTVQSSTDGTTWTSSAPTSKTALTIDGLVNGISVSFRVLATNARGTGAPSAIVTTSTFGVPAAPAIGTTTAQDGAVVVRWATADPNGAAVTGYVVEVSTGDPSESSTWSIGATADDSATSATVDGLTNGTATAFRVRAANARGESASSAVVTATPFTVPDAPDLLAAKPTDQGITIRWGAPSFNGGSVILGYIIERRTVDGVWEDIANQSSSDRTTTDTGLANGTAYSYRVSAQNLAGRSGPSTPMWATPRNVPGAPTGLAATPGDGRAQLSWTAPQWDGGNTITGYDVEQRTDGGTWVTVDTLRGSTATVTGLVNGTEYEFRVVASNDAGTGASSATTTTTPRGVPGAPGTLAAEPGVGSVTLTWSPPADDGGARVTGYVVEQQDGVAWAVIATTDGLTTSITGLPNGEDATFRVRASNAAGDGTIARVVTTTPRTVPDAPTALVAVPADGAVTLSWTAPVWDGGARISSYRVESSADGETWQLVGTASGTTTTVSGLSNGLTVQFRVAAQNVAGASVASGAVSSTPRTVAGAPTGLLATPGAGHADLAWVAPVADGGAAVARYIVQATQDRGASWSDVGSTSDVSLRVDGLENGTAVGFRVIAVNAAGRGAPGTPVTVTPRRSPGEPRAVSAVPANGSVLLSWSAPASDGGASIEGYLIEVADVDGSWGDPQQVDGTTTTVSGLENGREHRFRVAAVNAAGSGVWSDVATTTPFVFTPHFTDGSGTSLAGRTLTVGDDVIFWADQLPVGAFVSIELHSTVIVLANGIVGTNGTVRLAARIPHDVPAGSHHLVALIEGVGTTIAPVEVAVQVAPAPVAIAPSAPVPAATAPAAAHAPAVRENGTLASTGSGGTAEAATVSLAMLLAGLGVVLGRNRRRQPG
ncbi:beta strand repeat-containing protein [Mycetocola miduiensis]|uniref:Titin n=1 Tax=Mycetocola miduiensis TaxID=995034 RepID=A0A1I4YMY6_9MICO|nr:fibronectin type III domain-containing protein [Mycetocola miduiensis]SFN39391.1 titin [Mycetocola miduiensis]